LYIITKPEIIKILNKHQFENRVKKGFISYSKKQAVIPPVGELLFKEPPGEVHIKYGYIINEKYYVIKIASGFPRNGEIGLTNSQGIMLLFNQKSGEIESILLDDGYLTDIRTAIAGKICAKQFTNDIKTIGIIGNGIQARLQLKYLLDYTPCRDVMIWGRNLGHLKQYKKSIEKLGFNAKIASSISKLSDICNLIILTTSSKKPLLFKEHLKPGMHITALGADTKLKRELGPGVLSSADLIIADSIEQCKIRGEISHSLNEGEISINDIVELGNILDNTSMGRKHENDITIADLTGVAVQDVSIASKIFELYLKSINEI